MKTSYHPWQYFTVIVVVIAVTYIKIHIDFFKQGLTGTFYLAWITVVALLWDRIAGALAIVCSVVALTYLSKPLGFQLNDSTLTEAMELLIAGLIVYGLALRTRTLWRENSKLIAVANELRAVIKSLRKDAQGKSRQIEILNRANTQLDELVNQFIDSDAYWRAKTYSSPEPKLSTRKHKPT